MSELDYSVNSTNSNTNSNNLNDSSKVNKDKIEFTTPTPVSLVSFNIDDCIEQLYKGIFLNEQITISIIEKVISYMVIFY